MKPRKQLQRACQRRTFVDIHRSPRHADIVWGYVLAVGTQWVLVAEGRDGGYPDGLVAIRVKDVEAVTPEGSFQAEFAKTRDDWPAVPEGIDLESTRGLLRSAATVSPLVGIEREKKVSRAMWIGVPVLVDKKWTWLHEISPEAQWKKRPLAYRTKTITCVTFEDTYQRALASVMPKRPPRSVEKK